MSEYTVTRTIRMVRCDKCGKSGPEGVLFPQGWIRRTDGDWCSDTCVQAHDLRRHQEHVAEHYDKEVYRANPTAPVWDRWTYLHPGDIGSNDAREKIEHHFKIADNLKALRADVDIHVVLNGYDKRQDWMSDWGLLEFLIDNEPRLMAQKALLVK